MDLRCSTLYLMSERNKRVSYRVKREKRNSIPPSNQLLCSDELILLSSVVELKDVYQWILNQDANNLIHLLWLALLTVYAKLLKSLITTVVNYNYQLWVQLQMETSVQFIILITNVFSNHLVESLIIIIVITVSVFCKLLFRLIKQYLAVRGINTIQYRL